MKPATTADDRIRPTPQSHSLFLARSNHNSEVRDYAAEKNHAHEPGLDACDRTFGIVYLYAIIRVGNAVNEEGQADYRCDCSPNHLSASQLPNPFGDVTSKHFGASPLLTGDNPRETAADARVSAISSPQSNYPVS